MPGTHVMALKDMIHLCHHQAISHQFSFPGCGATDLHSRRASPDWRGVIARAQLALGHRPVTVFGLSRQLIDTPSPTRCSGLNSQLAPAVIHGCD
jgi:hypothetical protein